MAAVCATYLQARRRQEEEGTHPVRTDEQTGIQARERAASTQPLVSGPVARREFEYLGHGTPCLIAPVEVPTGQVLAPTVQATRTAKDLVTHLAQAVATAPPAPWIFVVDNLHIHPSEGLVRYVATPCGIKEDLGRKGTCGVLQSMARRQAFLADQSHRIRFVYVPQHTWWLHQVASWFSIRVRRVRRRGSLRSTAERRQRILAFIAYFKRTLAKPFQWTYPGRPLNVGAGRTDKRRGTAYLKESG